VDETDSFIEEVTEEVRRDKLFAAMRKYGWIGVVAILGIVGGAAYTEWSKAKARNQAEGFGDALLAAVESDDPAAALAAIEADGSRAALAQLMLAGQQAEAGNAEGALTAYRAVAANAAAPTSLRELARFKALGVAGDAMNAEERAAELSALAQPGAPYRLLALEAQAEAAVAAGDPEQAISLAKQILAEAGVTPGLQQRATELIVALGGDPAEQ